ncbi:hypothetical protein F0U44_01110 [Nocardioides humilatus]|uniref:Uncharacterized protein n=1 Tax=Nocardioides humilatus TaxID=2607660 RepID=A0A5B1LJS8_9ACTN|nr:hypothetical protein [Nocardioides humilatus]KAA1420971.1 hypothetical protein F0U44_01110 [Nocardioides humilatus]
MRALSVKEATAALVAVVCLGAAVTYGMDAYRDGDTDAPDTGRADAVAAARKAAVTLTSRAAGRAEVDAVVQEAAASSYDEKAGAAEVLVALDVTLRPKGAPSTLQRLRLSVSMEEDGGDWKATGSRTVSVGAAAPEGDGGDLQTEISTAMTQLWSYDYRALVGVDSLAPVTTPDFLDDYASTYEQIEELAPQTSAVVTATVSGVAVIAEEGDHASLLVFLDQRARKGKARPVDAGTRLRVEAEEIDGTWRVDGVTPV